MRANDTTDIWNVRGARYAASASRPFRTADLDPNAPTDLASEHVGAFVNDWTVRTLPGVTRAKAEIRPRRGLADDLEVTDPVLRAE